MYLFIYSSLHVSSMSCSSSGETNCTNTASGNCYSVLVAVSCAGWEFHSQPTTLKRICASSWTIAKNHCMMHGQQNVKTHSRGF